MSSKRNLQRLEPREVCALFENAGLVTNVSISTEFCASPVFRLYNQLPKFR